MHSASNRIVGTAKKPEIVAGQSQKCCGEKITGNGCKTGHWDWISSISFKKLLTLLRKKSKRFRCEVKS